MMIYSTFTISFLLIVSFVSVSGWINCPNGFKSCSTSDQPLTLNATGQVFVIQNCFYLGCPQIILSNGSLVISNATFSSSRQNGDNGGGALMMLGDPATRLSISNTRFLNCSISLNAIGGAAVYINGPFTNAINITNTSFENNINPIGNQGVGGGGGLYVTSGVTISLSKVNFIGNVAEYGAGFFLDTDVNFILEDCYSANNYANTFGGSMLLNVNVYGIIRRFTSVGDYSAYYTAVFFLNVNVGVEMTDVLILNCQAPSAPVLYGWGPIDVRISNMYVKGSVAFADWSQNGHIYAQGFTDTTFSNVTFEDCKYANIVLAWTSAFSWTLGSVKNFEASYK